MYELLLINSKDIIQRGNMTNKIQEKLDEYKKRFQFSDIDWQIFQSGFLLGYSEATLDAVNYGKEEKGK